MGMYLAQLKLFDNFLPHDIIPVTDPNLEFLNSDKYKQFVKVDEIFGYIYIFLVFSRVTDLSPQQVMFIPLGSLLLPISYIIITKQLPFMSIKNNLLYGVLPLYIIFDIGIITGYYNFYKYTLTYFLYFVFITLYIKNNNRNYNNVQSMVLITLFTAMVMIHYTIAVLTLLTLFIDSIIKYHRGKSKSLSLTILLVFLVIFVIIKFNTVITYFTQFSGTVTLDQISNLIINRVSTYLSLNTGSDAKSYILFNEGNNISLLLRAIRVILLITPLFMYIILKYILRHSIPSLNTYIWSIIGSIIIITLIYVNIGSKGIIHNSLLILFPIVVLSIFQTLSKIAYYTRIYLTVIIIINGLAFIFEINNIDYALRYASLEFNNKFINNLVNDNNFLEIKQKVLIDHKVMGLYAIMNPVSINLQPTYFTNEIYDKLLYSPNELDIDYIILQIDNKPIESTRWNEYKPINTYIANINSNNYLNRIFSDNITIMMTKKS